MRIGVPKEVKNNEYRVAITPAGVQALTERGHQVTVQTGAGLGSSISDEDYKAAGAIMEDDPDKVWGDAEMVLKVKEPIPEEYDRMHEGLLLFTYLHLAADKRLTEELLKRKVTSIAYETVQMPDGSLPLLAPMSEVAGRLAAQVGADALMKPKGGNGVLMGGAAGVRPAEVAVLGGGNVGLCAARVASGMGAHVTVYDVNPARMQYIEEISDGKIQTEYSSSFAVAEACKKSDLVIGAVLVPGAKAPNLVTNEVVADMKPGSVLVDVAIDQGGCFEDSHATTHQDPTYKVHGSTFYCVANMPGAMPNTSTYALTNATMRYCTLLADKGWKEAAKIRPELVPGIATVDGNLYTPGVAEALDMELAPVDVLMA